MAKKKSDGLKSVIEETKSKFKKVDKAIMKNRKEMAEDVAKLRLLFQGMGSECGLEIMEVAKKIHPDAIFLFPIYRGCVVIPKQPYSGSLKTILYHDPHWMGHDKITTENLPAFSQEFEILGQRSGQDFYLNGGELDESQWVIENFIRSLEDEASFEIMKEKDPNVIGFRMCDVPKRELQRRIVKKFWFHVRKTLYRFRTKEDDKKCKCGMPKIKCICNILKK